MNKTFWIITCAIVGLFAVIALLYHNSHLWNNGLLASTEEETPSTNDQKEQDDKTSTATNDSDDTKILLKPGDNGEAVRKLQKQLRDLGYDLAIDGQYGQTTQWFVKDVQLQLGIDGDGSYDTKTDSLLQKDVATIEPGKAIHLNIADRTITNPDDILALVNKTRKLPADYVPQQLVQPDVPLVFQGDNLPYNKMRVEAAEALEQMFTEAKREGLQLVARSGYRSYETQVAVFKRNEQKHGAEKANQYSARPGESEHQTGLVMDITCPAVGNELVVAFEETDEGKWVKEHAAKYGFIIRYPKGKESITGYQYEPWHLRYVGKEAAQAITAQNLTLEEYLLQQ